MICFLCKGRRETIRRLVLSYGRLEFLDMQQNDHLTVIHIIDFKLSPCAGCYILSFGCKQLAPHKMEGQCSETSAHKIQTPGNHPKETIQHAVQVFPRMLTALKFTKRVSAKKMTQQEFSDPEKVFVRLPAVSNRQKN